MKIKMVKIEDEERGKHKGFIKRVKERWDLEFPELNSVSMHNLRKPVSCFRKKPEIRNLILVRNRNEIDQQKDRVYEDPSNHQIILEHEDERDSTQNDRVHEANGLINENDNEKDLRIAIRAKNKELENIFNQILQDLKQYTVFKNASKRKTAKT